MRLVLESEITPAPVESWSCCVPASVPPISISRVVLVPKVTLFKEISCPGLFPGEMIPPELQLMLETLPVPPRRAGMPPLATNVAPTDPLTSAVPDKT